MIIVGQARGLRRPLRPPGRGSNHFRWVFDGAADVHIGLFAQERVLEDPLRSGGLPH